MLRILVGANRCPAMPALVRSPSPFADVCCLHGCLVAQSTASRGVIKAPSPISRAVPWQARRSPFAAPTSPPPANWSPPTPDSFTAAMLSPGAYTIEVKAPGFSLEEARARDPGCRQQLCRSTIRLGVAAISQERDRRRSWSHGGGQHAAARSQQADAASEQHPRRTHRHLSAQPRSRLHPVRTAGRGSAARA